VTFLADSSGKAVPGMDDGVVGKSKEFGDQRLHDFFRGTTPEVGAADAAREQRVASEKDRRGDRDLAGVGWKEKAGAAGCVTGSVNHLRGKIAPLQCVAFAQKLVDFGDGRRLDAEEGGLHFHSLIERNIVAVHQNRSAGVVVESLQAADVINVRVGADNGFDGEFVAAEQIHDAVNFVAWVDDDGFARDRIADDGAVALQNADGNGEVQQALAVVRDVACAIRYTVSI